MKSIKTIRVSVEINCSEDRVKGVIDWLKRDRPEKAVSRDDVLNEIRRTVRTLCANPFMDERMYRHRGPQPDTEALFDTLFGADFED